LKNQYFGDTRDLFKYDLALHCMASLGLRRLTFVPMLTTAPPTAGTWARAGSSNRPLVEFLGSCTREGRRDVRELVRFFEGRDEELLLWDKVLEEDRRLQYWTELPREWLEDAVVVVDPDNGMEVASGRGVKWLRYDELRYLYTGLGDRSVLLVFQFIPRVRREEYIPMIARRIVERAGVDDVQWVTDGHVVFYAMGDVGESAKGYGETYGLDAGIRHCSRTRQMSPNVG
jgi:hypothetical protein